MIMTMISSAIDPGIPRLLPNSRIRPVLWLLMGLIGLTLGSRLSVPLEPVPVTGQSLALLWLTLAFGWRLALVTVSGWLAVIVPGVGGWQQAGMALLVDPSGGYLVGFLLGAVDVSF